ncbi:hypothetical protein AAFG07_21105 [Bradyrhizobium sp. B097]|uniref:hypothetical protein n=1 Tax=Bradyrhizobium sp. B097 TaxID=3140244 RepID=UPI0031834353
MFLSFTNPVNPGGATMVQFLNGDHPTGDLSAIFAAMGMHTMHLRQVTANQ